MISVINAVKQWIMGIHHTPPENIPVEMTPWPERTELRLVIEFPEIWWPFAGLALVIVGWVVLELAEIWFGD